jgi:hypothetical protein
VSISTEHLPQALRLDAIHQQLQAFLDEGVFDGRDLAFQRQQTFLASHVAPAHHRGDQCLVIQRRRHEYPAHHLHAGAKHLEGALQHHRTEGAADDDEKGGRLDQGRDVAAFEHLPDEDRRQRESQANRLMLSMDAPRSCGWPAAGRRGRGGLHPGLGRRLDGAGNARAEPRNGLAMELAHAGFGNPQHFADFPQVHVLFVVKAHHRLLALGQIVDGLDQHVAHVAVEQHGERVVAFEGDVAFQIVVVAIAANPRNRQLVAARLPQHVLVVGQRHAEGIGQLGFGGMTAVALFEQMHRRLDASHVPAQAARQPVVLAQAVEHRAADALHRVGLELGAKAFS